MKDKKLKKSRKLVIRSRTWKNNENWRVKENWKRRCKRKKWARITLLYYLVF